MSKATTADGDSVSLQSVEEVNTTTQKERTDDLTSLNAEGGHESVAEVDNEHSSDDEVLFAKDGEKTSDDELVEKRRSPSEEDSSKPMDGDDSDIFSDESEDDEIVIDNGEEWLPPSPAKKETKKKDSGKRRRKKSKKDKGSSKRKKTNSSVLKTRLVSREEVENKTVAFNFDEEEALDAANDEEEDGTLSHKYVDEEAELVEIYKKQDRARDNEELGLRGVAGNRADKDEDDDESLASETSEVDNTKEGVESSPLARQDRTRGDLERHKSSKSGRKQQLAHQSKTRLGNILRKMKARGGRRRKLEPEISHYDDSTITGSMDDARKLGSARKTKKKTPKAKRRKSSRRFEIRVLPPSVEHQNIASSKELCSETQAIGMENSSGSRSYVTTDEKDEDMRLSDVEEEKTQLVDEDDDEEEEGSDDDRKKQDEIGEMNEEDVEYSKGDASPPTVVVVGPSGDNKMIPTTKTSTVTATEKDSMDGARKNEHEADADEIPAKTGKSLFDHVVRNELSQDSSRKRSRSVSEEYANLSETEAGTCDTSFSFAQNSQIVSNALEDSPLPGCSSDIENEELSTHVPDDAKSAAALPLTTSSVEDDVEIMQAKWHSERARLRRKLRELRPTENEANSFAEKDEESQHILGLLQRSSGSRMNSCSKSRSGSPVELLATPACLENSRSRLSKGANNTDGKKRLVILELQGELALFNGSMKKKGEKIGDISLDPKGKPVLVIGFHRLEGKFEKLKLRALWEKETWKATTDQ
eukprot:g1752.t1